MKFISFSILFCGLLFGCHTTAQDNSVANQKIAKTKTMENSTEKYPIIKSEAEWLDELGQKRYHILREKGTEMPNSGKYNLHFEKGTYICGACQTPLFESNSKFESSCGWPSFDNAIEGTVEYVKDTSHGMVRTEILCAACGSHLGHIFNDGPTESGKRFCVNSLSLNFQEE